MYQRLAGTSDESMHQNGLRGQENAVRELPAWSGCVHGCMVMQLLRSVHAGMQAFASAVTDEGLLGLCDIILEALLFCPGFQSCLTSGAVCQLLHNITQADTV